MTPSVGIYMVERNVKLGRDPPQDGIPPLLSELDCSQDSELGHAPCSAPQCGLIAGLSTGETIIQSLFDFCYKFFRNQASSSWRIFLFVFLFYAGD